MARNYAMEKEDRDRMQQNVGTELREILRDRVERDIEGKRERERNVWEQRKEDGETVKACAVAIV